MDKAIVIRAKFTKEDEVKFISHLDTARAFERAIRRSNLPILYSEGFNPKPKIIFASALSVGTTSKSEYADFSFEKESITSNQFMEYLNSQLPQGIKILKALTFASNKKNIMSSVTAASYDVLVDVGNIPVLNVEENIVNFMKKKSMVVDFCIEKNHNIKKHKQIDIRKLTHKLELLEPYSKDEFTNYEYKDVSGQLALLSMLLSSGSQANLSPNYLIDGLTQEGLFVGEILHVHRTEIFLATERGFYPPLEEC